MRERDWDLGLDVEGDFLLGWRGVEDVWRASIAQGVFEGLVVGLLFSTIFTIAVGAVIATFMPPHDPWLFMASFAAPGAVVFGAYWLISRRL